MRCPSRAITWTYHVSQQAPAAPCSGAAAPTCSHFLTVEYARAFAFLYILHCSPTGFARAFLPWSSVTFYGAACRRPRHCRAEHRRSPSHRRSSRFLRRLPLLRSTSLSRASQNILLAGHARAASQGVIALHGCCCCFRAHVRCTFRFAPCRCHAGRGAHLRRLRSTWRCS